MPRPPFVADEHLRFLDELRESGVTNMYGAAVYLREHFVLSKTEARAVLRYWMDSYEERHP